MTIVPVKAEENKISSTVSLFVHYMGSKIRKEKKKGQTPTQNTVYVVMIKVSSQHSAKKYNFTSLDVNLDLEKYLEKHCILYLHI